MNKNLFLNGDFKDGTRGWSLQTVSTLDSNNWVTGTLSAGAANFTQGLSSAANALEGRVSGTWTKSNVNAQKQGFLSEAIQVDKLLLGNIVSFNFGYNLTQNSGTLSLTGVVGTHDIKIAIYDVANSAWIQPSGHLSINSIGIASIAKGEFQAPINATQFYIFVYQATTSTAGWTIVADQFYLGRTDLVNGSVDSDWQSYTPTGTWVTNATYSGYYRRVGSNMEINAQVTLGGAPTGNFTLNLPTGFSIDTAKAPSSTPAFGVAFAFAAGTTRYTGTVRYTTTTSVQIVGPSSSAAWSATVPATFQSGDQVSLIFSVPISGWTASTLLSNDSDTRVVDASIVRGSNQTGVNPNNSAVKIQYNSVIKDSHGAFDSITNFRYNVLIPGDYVVKPYIQLDNSNVLNSRYFIRIQVNGSTNFDSSLIFPAASAYASLTSTQSLPNLKAGDYFEVYLFGVGNNSVSTLTVTSESKLGIEKVSGPTAIAASEKVFVEVENGSGTLLTGGDATNVLTYPTKIQDSHGAFTSNTTFTAPRADRYTFIAYLAIQSLASAARIIVTLRKNGSSYRRLSLTRNNTGAAATLPNRAMTASLYLLAGQTADLTAIFDDGSNRNLESSGQVNYLTIESQGGI